MKLTEEDIRIRLAHGLGSQLEIGYHLPDKSEQLKKQILENQEKIKKLLEIRDMIFSPELYPITVGQDYTLKFRDFALAINELCGDKPDIKVDRSLKSYLINDENQRLRELVEEEIDYYNRDVDLSNDMFRGKDVRNKLQSLLDKAKGEK